MINYFRSLDFSTTGQNIEFTLDDAGVLVINGQALLRPVESKAEFKQVLRASSTIAPVEAFTSFKAVIRARAGIGAVRSLMKTEYYIPQRIMVPFSSINYATRGMQVTFNALKPSGKIAAITSHADIEVPQAVKRAILTVPIHSKGSLFIPPYVIDVKGKTPPVDSRTMVLIPTFVNAKGAIGAVSSKVRFATILKSASSIEIRTKARLGAELKLSAKSVIGAIQSKVTFANVLRASGLIPAVASNGALRNDFDINASGIVGPIETKVTFANILIAGGSTGAIESEAALRTAVMLNARGEQAAVETAAVLSLTENLEINATGVVGSVSSEAIINLVEPFVINATGTIGSVKTRIRLRNIPRPEPTEEPFKLYQGRKRKGRKLVPISMSFG